ncbi:Endonuclease MutS2 [Vitis vinifera]|uniref:Endonuclease MutS2 n=1 Tax=Vitis vinifera TaxID=29760 RepID=A0A438E0Q9_VITVI|nr:Endonuclease MutS2 [Vitis vinifera]
MGWKADIGGLRLDEISQQEAETLERPFTEEEIYVALMEMNGDKAPGRTALQWLFWQSCWEFIKEEILEMFKDFYDHSSFLKSLNNTFLVLIPKKSGAEDLRDFRPISLLGGLYKLLSKVLANRLKKVVGEVVSTSQNAFVKGRQILDASLIANEVIDTWQKQKEKGIICKLDIEKAYDNINWKFLVKVLQKMGFGSKWVGWMWSCLSSVKFSVLVNGVPAGCSIRGGNGSSLNIPHLFFADDTIIFCEARKDHLTYLGWILFWFEAASGLRINLAKSEVIPVGEVVEVEELAVELGCRVGTLPSQYLGLPLGAPNRAPYIWDGVEERVRRRLALWKRQYISKGGRVTLIKRKGNMICFWTDVWCSDSSLAQCSPHLFGMAAHQSLTVEEMWDQIRGFKPSLEEDSVIWRKEEVCQLKLLCFCVGGVMGEVVRALWDIVFGLVDVKWVFPGTVKEVLASWRGSFVGKKRKKIWDAIPLCIFWTLYQLMDSLVRNNVNETSSLEVSNVDGRWCIKSGANLTNLKGLLLSRSQRKRTSKSSPASNASVGSIIEPLSAIPLNDELQQARALVAKAEADVLLKLTEKMQMDLEDIEKLLDSVIQLDVVDQCSSYLWPFIWSTCPDLFLAEKKNGSSTGAHLSGHGTSEASYPIKREWTLHLPKAYHPLLVQQHRENLQKARKDVSLAISVKLISVTRLEQSPPVPVDFFIAQRTRVLVITGPNTGGKTICLKTVGLAAMMARSGLHVLASEPVRIPWFDYVFADIGDEQSLSQSLSTFSGHLKQISDIKAQSTNQSLVLLDEVGAGTNPLEGAALGMSLLESFAETGALLTIATTHHSELKTLKYSNDAFENACMEFDEVNLKPTYKILWGIPGRSNAINIAERLGVPKKVLDKAREQYGAASAEINEVIIDMERFKQEFQEHALRDLYENLLVTKRKLMEHGTDQRYRKMREVSEAAGVARSLLHRRSDSFVHLQPDLPSLLLQIKANMHQQLATNITAADINERPNYKEEKSSQSWRYGACFFPRKESNSLEVESSKGQLVVQAAPFWNVESLSWSRPCSNRVDKIQVFLLSRRGRARIKYMQSNLGLNLNCLSSLPLLSALLNYDPAKSQLNSKDRGPKWAYPPIIYSQDYYLSESILFYAASMKTMGQVLNRKIRGGCRY